MYPTLRVKNSRGPCYWGRETCLILLPVVPPGALTVNIGEKSPHASRESRERGTILK
jgi:hypothetical protein